MSVGKMRYRNGKLRYYLGSKEVSRNRYIRAIKKAKFGSFTKGKWPLLSDAMGVSPEQIQEASEAAKAIGVPTEFHPTTGQAIFTGPGHRKAYCRAHGFHQKSGGYGDP